MNLKIGYFYPKLLNLYGDNGNIEVLVRRAEARGIKTSIYEINPETKINSQEIDGLNLVFMGGGPDSSQKSIYEDLFYKKGSYLRDFINNNGVGLFICGAYQLLGHYYKAADGDVIKGLGVFDCYTEHFGNHKPRCIGNVVCSLSENISKDPSFVSDTKLGKKLVGFENHGGRTYLGTNALPLATIDVGFGNNGEDRTEGLQFKNSFGTYFHGPLLAKNPHFADFLIAKSLKIHSLESLDDSLIITAHFSARNLKN